MLGISHNEVVFEHYSYPQFEIGGIPLYKELKIAACFPIARWRTSYKAPVIYNTKYFLLFQNNNTAPLVNKLPF